ncbi:hypothetical protein Sinac_1556 [Singulisphaera acidiphila DSM 18658]|uniref:Uncharacterized protein n=1 Tax=Singulisphaera acidiphila (strain ATCC BAA-1392 / DSM 18658 / VKM B-2454 / MOB10) TaxID=886293 RepID=L0DAR5_SINAD|nr:hypothetical protein Sinac_1556 [Singulisphaera acidiphila DSM 18658]
MVVEVFVAQGQTIDALGQEVFQGVLDEVRIAMVGKAGGELADDPGAGFDLTEQKCTAVGRDGAPVKIGEHLAVTEDGKVEVSRVTLCSHRAALVRCQKWLSQFHL